MARKLISAAELEKLIQDGISSSTALAGYCRDCNVNSVYWHEPDESGSNWDLRSFSGSPNCTDFILGIVAKLKPIYNLAD